MSAASVHTLSLHDALPIFRVYDGPDRLRVGDVIPHVRIVAPLNADRGQILPSIFPPELAVVLERAERSEEHTSELQSRFELVFRLLLEKKKNPRDFFFCDL